MSSAIWGSKWYARLQIRRSQGKMSSHFSLEMAVGGFAEPGRRRGSLRNRAAPDARISGLFPRGVSDSHGRKS
jgi:hypothetical protein